MCGATNHKAGDVIALATVGTKLPNGLKIKKGKIKRKVKPNKPQLDHKFQPVATSLCAPEVTPVKLPKEEKEVSLLYISN